MGRGLFYGVSRASHPKTAELVPALPKLGVLLYMPTYPLPQNGQIQHGNTYVNERF